MAHPDDPGDRTNSGDADHEAEGRELNRSSEEEGSPDQRNPERFQATIKTWAAAISALATVIMAIVAVIALNVPQRAADPADPRPIDSPVAKDHG
ncbi:hypothetical protein [Streptomyces griseoluteus]